MCYPACWDICNRIIQTVTRTFIDSSSFYLGSSFQAPFIDEMQDIPSAATLPFEGLDKIRIGDEFPRIGWEKEHRHHIGMGLLDSAVVQAGINLGRQRTNAPYYTRRMRDENTPDNIQ